MAMQGMIVAMVMTVADLSYLAVCYVPYSYFLRELSQLKSPGFEDRELALRMLLTCHRLFPYSELP